MKCNFHRIDIPWSSNVCTMLPTILPMNRVIQVHQEDLRSKWAVWQKVDFDKPDSFQKQSMALLQAPRAGEVTGLARAFVADMGAGVELFANLRAPSHR